MRLQNEISWFRLEIEMFSRFCSQNSATTKDHAGCDRQHYARAERIASLSRTSIPLHRRDADVNIRAGELSVA